MNSGAAMKELEVTIKVRNNRLKRRREELGLSAPAFAEAAGISYHTYIALESLRLSPVTADGEWREPVHKIADYHGLSADELFPPVVLAVKQPKVTRELSGPEVGGFLSAYQQRAALPPSAEMESAQRKETAHRMLALLSDREREIIRLRFGVDGTDGLDLAGVGEKLGVSRERVRQIEIKALRKIRLLGDGQDDIDLIERRHAARERLRTESLESARAVASALREKREENQRRREEEARQEREERARKREELRRTLANRTPEEIEADRAAKERAKEARRAAAVAAAERRRLEQEHERQLMRQREEERQRAYEEWYRADAVGRSRPAGPHAWDWLPPHRTWRCDSCKALAWPLADGFSYSDVGEQHQSDPPTCDPERWAAYLRGAPRPGPSQKQAR